MACVEKRLHDRVQFFFRNDKQNFDALKIVVASPTLFCCGHFPIALIAARDVVGSIQSSGNPIMIAVSCTFKQRTV